MSPESNKLAHDFLINQYEAGNDKFQNTPGKYKLFTDRESYRKNYNKRETSENSVGSPEINNSGSSLHNSCNKTGRKGKGNGNNFRAPKQNFEYSEIKLSTKLTIDKNTIASKYISSREPTRFSVRKNIRHYPHTRDEPLRPTRTNLAVTDKSNDADRLTVNNKRIQVQDTRNTELGSWGIENKGLLTNSMEYLGQSKSPGKFVIRSSAGLNCEEFYQNRNGEKLKPKGVRMPPKNAMMTGNWLMSEKRNKFVKRNSGLGSKWPGVMKSSVDVGRHFEEKADDACNQTDLGLYDSPVKNSILGRKKNLCPNVDLNAWEVFLKIKKFS